MSRRIRRPVFASRSALPASAACVVANGVRETLTSLFGTTVELRLVEPSIPSPSAWLVILKDAALYRVRGKIADAVVVLRPADALAMAAALFGERLSSGGARQLSPIERDLLDRTVNAVSVHLGSVCGARDGRGVERVSTIQSYATYFELLLEKPIVARIGFGLSRDPLPEPRGRVEIGHLASVSLTARAILDLGLVPSRSVARLHAGAILYLRAGALQRCALSVHGRALARGRCGVRNGHYAISLDGVRGA